MPNSKGLRSPLPIALGATCALVLSLSGFAMGRVIARSEGVHVCVGADRVLRYESRPTCPRGQESYVLAEEEGKIEEPPEDERGSSAEVAELKRRVDFLTRRISSLEQPQGGGGRAAAGPGRRVVAPFEVVDGAGNPILLVTDAPLSAGGRGHRIRIGRGSGSNYGIWIRSAGGRDAAAILEATTGAGLIDVYDRGGERRARIYGEHGITVSNPSGNGVVNLTLGKAGGGVFQLLDTGGRTTVEAGTTGSGAGVVRVGPLYKCAPQAGLRVGDCILGRTQ
jgi:hypothetical protein